MSEAGWIHADGCPKAGRFAALDNSRYYLSEGMDFLHRVWPLTSNGEPDQKVSGTWAQRFELNTLFYPSLNVDGICGETDCRLAF